MPDPLVPGTAAAELVAALAAQRQTVATAESLTAGLIAATIAGVPGASVVLRGGLIVYATDLASTLAEGAAERCAATWGVGVTGVAGPDPQDGHPPGTLYVGIAGPGGTVVTRPSVSGDRWDIRTGATRAAVSGLLTRVHAAAGM